MNTLISMLYRFLGLVEPVYCRVCGKRLTRHERCSYEIHCIACERKENGPHPKAKGRYLYGLPLASVL